MAVVGSSITNVKIIVAIRHISKTFMRYKSNSEVNKVF